MEVVYTGPYPTAEEAYADLRNSDASLTLETLHSPETENRIGLEPELAKHLADEAFDYLPSDTDIRYAYLDDEHLLLASEFRGPDEWHIYLVDLSAQRVVTAYPHHQFPPDIDEPFSAFPD